MKNCITKKRNERKKKEEKKKKSRTSTVKKVNEKNAKEEYYLSGPDYKIILNEESSITEKTIKKKFQRTLKRKNNF